MKAVVNTAACGTGAWGGLQRLALGIRAVPLEVHLFARLLLIPGWISRTSRGQVDVGAEWAHRSRPIASDVGDDGAWDGIHWRDLIASLSGSTIVVSRLHAQANHVEILRLELKGFIAGQ